MSFSKKVTIFLAQFLSIHFHSRREDVLIYFLNHRCVGVSHELSGIPSRRQRLAKWCLRAWKTGSSSRLCFFLKRVQSVDIFPPLRGQTRSPLTCESRYDDISGEIGTERYPLRLFGSLSVGLLFLSGTSASFISIWSAKTFLVFRAAMFLSSKIVTVSPKNQAERFCQGVRPLLNEWGLTELYQSRT